MATAPDPDRVLGSTCRKDNFQRISRLLISGGTTLLREVFDQICPPRNLPTILNDPIKKNQLKAAKLTKPQRDCLYPSPGTYGKSEDFDVTLLFRLLRTICNLIPPSTGWDALPAITDHSLAADLARIKYYRNSVYGHVNQNMEIKDDEFVQLWQEISQALVRIAGQISPIKKRKWQKAIDNFLKDPLTAEDERNVQELQEWYESDKNVKKSLEIMEKEMENLKKSVDRLSKQEGKCPVCGTNSCPFSLPDDTDIASIHLIIKCLEITQQSGHREPAVLAGIGNRPPPTTQDVLNLASQKYLQKIDPSTPEEFNGFLQYLRDVRQLLFVDAKPGSLIITVECRSLQILDDLWNDYCVGVVNEMAQKYLVTKEILNELGLKEAKLTTIVPEHEYRSCRKQLSEYEEGVSDSVLQDLEQKIQQLRNHQDKLRYQCLNWARVRKNLRGLHTEFVRRPQAPGISVGRAAQIAAVTGAVVTAPFTLGMSLFYGAAVVAGAAGAAAVAGAAGAAGAAAMAGSAAHIWSMLGRNDREVIVTQDKEALEQLPSMVDSLKQLVADLAVYCREHSDQVLSSTLMAREFPFLRDILLRKREEVRAPRLTLPALLEKELNVYSMRLPSLVQRLLQCEPDNEDSRRISRQILDELQEVPNDEQIRAMIEDFIKREFTRNY